MIVTKEEFAGFLKQARTIAIVGLSTNPWATSNYIAKHLQLLGYTIIPVNPKYDSILDEPCYPSLAAIPKHINVDIVNIFRNAEFTLEVIQDAVEAFGSDEHKPLLWTQLGVHHPDAQALAVSHGFPYVAERCIDTEYVRAFGEKPLVEL